MMDQRFHRLFHLGPLGRNDLAIVTANRAFWHLLQTLLHDTDGLTHFFNAHHEPVITIAPRADRNIEFHPVIHIIRLAFADIPRDARTTDHRAGKAPFDRIFLRNNRDIDIALLKNTVVDNKRHRIFKQAGHAIIQPFSDVGQQLQRHILMHAARTEPSRMHTCTTRPFIKAHDVFANFIQPQGRCHRANVNDMVRNIQCMVLYPSQLSKQHPQILGAERHFQVQQLLDSEHIAMLHRHRRRVIQTVKIGQSLQIGLILYQLFRAAMQKTDMRVKPLDDFTIQLHH